MSVIPLQRHAGEVEYPESDGQPMAESDLHQEEMIYLKQALRNHFRDVPDVYVASNMFLYFKQGDPRSVVAPDLFVIKGVSKERRKKYLLWEEEGRVPCFVVEVTSASTRREDLLTKKACYERLGVEEYFLLDPLGEYLESRLVGYRLGQGRYLPIEPGEDGSLESRTTGVLLLLEGTQLRMIDAATGRPLRRPEEWVAAQEAEEARRQAAEEEVARLRQELERLRSS